MSSWAARAQCSADKVQHRHVWVVKPGSRGDSAQDLLHASPSTPLQSQPLSCRDMEAAPGLMLHEEEPAGKYARASLAGSKSSNRHIQTEQRRRDRINEGYVPRCCPKSC